ncbi:MAG: adenylate kinase, adenylate kinase [Candidatus Peregrinibacteria bacterium GW2011_GWC2_39_14]|nr:MAG: Adenylate kinase [Candidatus Peregrinibacteria bacterium GW2011_GWA2_38_36]KKR06844.1 MAG: adenylate kinase, adenylate kinase [Candidatus Peregrinibacteria bacterium GW2011_GWC2_39_14]
MDFVLFGIQGSGKGTQSKFLAEKFNLKIFEMGGQLRILAQEDSELGKKIKNIIEAGHLVPTDVVMEIIENFIKNIPENTDVLFDGIPRSLEQAEQFNALMEKSNRQFAGVYFELSKEEAIRRLTTRRMCKICKTIYPAAYMNNTCTCGGELITRADDNIASIENRINAFFNETMPIISAYESKNIIIKVDALPPIEKVTESMMEKVEMFLVKSS